MKVFRKLKMKHSLYGLIVVSFFLQFYLYQKDSNAESDLPTPSPPVIEVGDISSFLIKWDDSNATNIAGYRLYRSEDDINYFSVEDHLLTNASYEDTNLNREKRYYYRIGMVDLQGNESPLSNSASAVIDQYILDENILVNSHFSTDLEGWSVGINREVQHENNSEWSEAIPTIVDDGYESTIKNAGQDIMGQGKAVKFSINGANHRAKTTLYQRKLDVVPTGKPIQLSFAWKKNCQCEPANTQSLSKINNPTQILRIEIVRPDSSWVTVWDHTAIAEMSEYTIVEDLDITNYVTQPGTYDIRIIAELATAHDDDNARNEISFDEIFLSFEQGPSPIKDVRVDVVNEGGALMVSWNAQNEDVDGFYIYRSNEVTGPFERIHAQPLQETSYLDTDLQNGQLYYYQIKAIYSEIESIGSRPVRGVPTYIDPINHPHHTYNENTNACASCHITHKSKSKKAMKEVTEASTCLTCHNGTGSRYDTNSQFSENDTSSHPVIGTPLAPNGSMQCSSCHNPHATNGTRVNPPYINGSLSRKSGVSVEYNKDFPFTNPVSFAVKDYIEKEEELCFSCHSTISNAKVETKATSTAKEYHPANRSGHRISSKSELSGLGGYVNGWSATTAVKCTDCHGSQNSENHEGVHGSQYENVLKREFSTKTVGSDQNALCFECHDQASYGGNAKKDSSLHAIGNTRFKQKGSTEVGQTNVGINLHNYWNESSNRGHLGVACAQCHSAVPHSSEKYPALLVDRNDPEPYQKFNENTNIKIYYPSDGDWEKYSCGTVGSGCHNNTN